MHLPPVEDRRSIAECRFVRVVGSIHYWAFRSVNTWWQFNFRYLSIYYPPCQSNQLANTRLLRLKIEVEKKISRVRFSISICFDVFTAKKQEFRLKKSFCRRKIMLPKTVCQSFLFPLKKSPIWNTWQEFFIFLFNHASFYYFSNIFLSITLDFQANFQQVHDIS